MTEPPPPAIDRRRFKLFIQAARECECDMEPERFKARVRRMARTAPDAAASDREPFEERT